jgi:hypothetical protein
MRIINPSFGLAGTSAERSNAGAVDWRRDGIALFSNSKPNAKDLLEGLRDKLAGMRPAEGIDFYYKDTASRPAPAATIENIAQKHRAALLALGD